jgi:hypothetical protein
LRTIFLARTEPDEAALAVLSVGCCRANVQQWGHPRGALAQICGVADSLALSPFSHLMAPPLS